MWEVITINTKYGGDKQVRTFDNEYYYHKYLNKIKKNKNIVLLSYGKIK